MVNSSNVMNERKHERTNIRTDKGQGESYIPLNINAGGINIAQNRFNPIIPRKDAEV